MTDPKTPPEMSKEDVAFFIRSLWTALLEPDWERSDLIDLGMAVFTKTPLSKLDPKKFGKLFPYLTAVAEELGALINNHLTEKSGEAIKAAQTAARADQAAATQPLAPVLTPPPPAPEVISLTAKLPAATEPEKGESDG